MLTTKVYQGIVYDVRCNTDMITWENYVGYEAILSPLREHLVVFIFGNDSYVAHNWVSTACMYV